MADLVHAVQQSNLPYHQKSALARTIDSIRSGGRAGMIRAGQHGLATVNVIRKYSEAGFTGAALGAAHVFLPDGLDLKIPGSSTRIPLDFVGAAGGAMIAIALPGQPGAEDAANIGGNMAGIFSFRKTFDFLAAKRKKAGGHVGGTFAGEGDYDGEMTSGNQAEAILMQAIKAL